MGRLANSAEMSLLDGIVCEHGLACKTRPKAVAHRADIERLLELSLIKEKAYLAVWPDARDVPKLRLGHSQRQLLCISEVCKECDNCEALLAPATQTLTVRRRYASGTLRKLGNIKVPLTSLTSEAVKTAVNSQLKLPVAGLFVANAEGEFTEVRSCEALPA